MRSQASQRKPTKPAKLVGRVHAAAEAAFARQGFVSPIDVLCGIGWLSGNQVDFWRQGRSRCLEELTHVDATKLTDAVRILAAWAAEKSLRASEVDYVAATRDRRQLCFTANGDEAVERSYRTHWISPDLSESKRTRWWHARASRPTSS